MALVLSWDGEIAHQLTQRLNDPSDNHFNPVTSVILQSMHLKIMMRVKAFKTEMGVGLSQTSFMLQLSSELGFHIFPLDAKSYILLITRFKKRSSCTIIFPVTFASAFMNYVC